MAADINMKLRRLRRDLGLGIIVVALLAASITYQRHKLAGTEQRWDKFEQRTNMPPSELLKMITIGYDNVYADWLWLQSIQAFGMGWITEDLSTKPIYNYFDTLTDIDPHFISAYRFGNLIIGDNRQDWKLGQELLMKGVFANPNDYQIPYLGLYNAIWEKDDSQQARWFAHMLQRTNAPNFMKRLQEYIERREGRYEVAYEYNVRYYLQYMISNNDVERDIIEKRLRGLLDTWYRKPMNDAIVKYFNDHGEGPTAYEQLLDPKYRPNFTAPTSAAFQEAIARHEKEIDLLDPNKEIPQDILDTIRRDSEEHIVGLPPEPYGTWYMIHGPTRHVHPGFNDKGEADYLVSAKDLLPLINGNSYQAQTFILNYIKENGEKPDDLVLKAEGLITRDPLGGHYIYDPNAPESPEYGMYYSTAARRIGEGQAMRMGMSGLPPYIGHGGVVIPSIEPRLSDYPIDKFWGIANGYILPNGTEVWERDSDKKMDDADQSDDAGKSIQDQVLPDAAPARIPDSPNVDPTQQTEPSKN